jgi:SAM-dependent methyltransferase
MTVKSIDEYFNSKTFIQDSESNDNAFGEQLGYFDYKACEHSYSRTAALRLRELSRYRAPPGRLLEIGSATGWFLDAARKSGYEVRGLDVSRTFAEMALRERAVEVDVGWIEEFALPRARYDVVCMFGGISCWRGLPEGLANVHQALAPRGVFFFNYADFHSLLARLTGDRYPEFNHASLSILHRESMHRALKRVGFRVLRDHTEKQIASLNRITTYLKLKAAVTLVDRWGLGEVEIPVWAFGTRLVVAAKE